MVLHYSKTLTNEVKKGYIWIARRYHTSGSKQIITAELNYLEQRQKINDFFQLLRQATVISKRRKK
jgi:hypothetical protein